ncbi:MAG: PLP-dependent aminotransferase family protein [Erysipelotrichaceae bacterium]|nr:PLP-dependent aminotransferase family protein [Erysipelotrichaceae bacterium]
MLTYNIPDNPDIPLYQYIYECIKNDIRNGNIRAHEKLPSKRKLASQLEVSLITIENAYSQLLIEGYISSIEKKGYYVSEVEIIHSTERNDILIYKEREINNDYIDFSSFGNNAELFPFSIWSKLSRKVISENKDIILSKPGYKGCLELREAISKHLKDFFTMDVSSNNIIIGSGSEYLYSLLVQLFDKDIVYAIEDPGHKAISKVYEVNSCHYEYIPMDDKGIDINILNKSKASVVHVSSSHQYPTGILMPVSRRYELIRWARENKGYIIEDEYDSEFRLKGKPVPPIYDLDKKHTIYMNTFSITLSSSMRIAYMILPDELLQRYEEKLGFYQCSVSTLDQLILSRFINEHHYERHISRMRKKYKETRDFFIDNLKKSPYHIKIKEADSGLHFLIEYDYNISDRKCLEIAERLKIKIHVLSEYSHVSKDTHTLILRYMAIEDKEKALIQLNSLFEELKKGE